MYQRRKHLEYGSNDTDGPPRTLMVTAMTAWIVFLAGVMIYTVVA
jgi:hypothetical protein